MRRRVSNVAGRAGLVVLAFGLAVAPRAAWAQEQEKPPADEPTGLTPGWSAGPTVGKLGTWATIEVPEGYYFLDRDATIKMIEANRNVPGGDELGTVARFLDDDYWFVTFTYSDTGHIDDSDRASIDAGALMQALHEINRKNNEERRGRGWAPVILDGWQREPYYDPATKNLTWATRLKLENGPVHVNTHVRVLGRTGVMSAQLVATLGIIEPTLKDLNQLLTGLTFNDGQRYSEFRQGDKVAGYGLTALIGGGVAAAAVKTGFLQKFWKLLVFGFAAAVGLLSRFRRMFGPRQTANENAGVPPLPTP